MGKRIKTMFILLTALLLAAGAFLPAIAAAVMDTAAGKRTSTAPMQSLELEVSDEQPPSNESREPADMISKLILASRMYTIPISENETSMVEADVLAAAEWAMEEYIAAGVFDWFDVTYSSADPMLGLDAENPEDHMTFWSVYFTNENDPYQALTLYIDDGTGRVIYIKYEKYGSFSPEGAWERNQAVLDAVTTVFFQQLGLSERKEYANSTGIGLEVLEMDGYVTCIRYRFADDIYGEWKIDFYANGAGGFEIYFPGAQ